MRIFLVIFSVYLYCPLFIQCPFASRAPARTRPSFHFRFSFFHRLGPCVPRLSPSAVVVVVFVVFVVVVVAGRRSPFRGRGAHICPYNSCVSPSLLTPIYIPSDVYVRDKARNKQRASSFSWSPYSPSSQRTRYGRGNDRSAGSAANALPGSVRKEMI